MHDPQGIREALPLLAPEQRLDVEDLVTAKILRDANARDEARDPEGARLVREHAEAVVAALPNPLPPGASEAVREALATVVRAILTEESGDVSDGA